MRRAAAGIVLAAVVLAVAPPASATVTATGWWTRSPTASAPEGGVAVANAPDGPLTVAAVAVDLGDGVSSATLTLEQTGGAAPAGSQIVVCALSSTFTAAAGGPMEEAPATTCDRASVPLTASDTTWRANVGELVGDRSGTVALAIVPVAGSVSLWDLQFDRPSVATTPAAGSSSPSADPFPTATTTAPRPSPAPNQSPPAAFAVPQPPSVGAPATTVPVEEEMTTTTEAGIANLAVGAPTSAGSAGGAGEGRPIGQAISMVLIAAVVGVGAGVAHRVAAARLRV